MISLCRALFLVVLLGGIYSPLSAQTISVPNVAEAEDVSGLNTPIRSAARVYQQYFNQINFASITTPTLISGMQFRLALNANSEVATGASWPSQPLTFTNYDIELSRGSAAVQTDGEFVSATVPFSGNQGGTVVPVRSGALTIPANSFVNNGNTSPNDYGFLISFTTPYLYTPGEEMVMTIRHTGYIPSTELQPFFASTEYAPNFTDAVSSTVGYTATTPGGFSSPMYVQFSLAVPEPGCMGLVAGASVFGLIRRRVRR